MTEDDIIDLADKAGITFVTQSGVASATVEWLQKFADMVAAKERERLATRQWQGLTKDEVDEWELPDRPTVFEFAQFVESKLKEKNA